MDMGPERCIQKSGVWRLHQQKSTDIKNRSPLSSERTDSWHHGFGHSDSSPVQEYTPLAKSQADGGGCSSGFTKHYQIIPLQNSNCVWVSVTCPRVCPYLQWCFTLFASRYLSGIYSVLFQVTFDSTCKEILFLHEVQGKLIKATMGFTSPGFEKMQISSHVYVYKPYCSTRIKILKMILALTKLMIFKN